MIEIGEGLLPYGDGAGKGDHRHVGGGEYDYYFVDTDQLMVDFWSDVDRWRRT